jgi:HK97 gp10 family phage protein
MSFEMNMKIQADLKGLDTAGVEGKLAHVVWLAARNIEKKSKEIVPVDTGATKNSIFIDPGRPAMSAKIGPTTEYAPFIEFGTRYWEGKPFMIPAAEAERKRFEDAIAQVFERFGSPQIGMF